MKTLVILMTLAWAASQSPFPSTVDGVTIRNVHEMVKKGDGAVLRGSLPGSKYTELYDHGVRSLLIFKNELHGEVDQERKQFQKAGIESQKILHIPFQWKDLPEDAEVCRQVVTALKFLESALESGEKVYFHCTFGEDRTGLLAGIFRMHYQGWKTERAFKDEMCRWGYEHGDPKKGAPVVAAIRKELTPVFLKFAEWIENGKLEKLSVSLCKGADFSNVDTSQYRCSPSPKAE